MNYAVRLPCITLTTDYFDVYENNAYEIQQELKRHHPELNLVVLIGSVRNTHRMETVFEKYHPDIVYHAAAHKHVPLMETVRMKQLKIMFLEHIKQRRQPANTV